MLQINSDVLNMQPIKRTHMLRFLVHRVSYIAYKLANHCKTLFARSTGIRARISGCMTAIGG